MICREPAPRREQAQHMARNLEVRSELRDIPGGPVVGESACYQDTGLITGPGRSHAVEQLNLCATTSEGHMPRAHVATRAAPAVRSPCATTRQQPPLTTREPTQQQRPSTAKERKRDQN